MFQGDLYLYCTVHICCPIWVKLWIHLYMTLCIVYELRENRRMTGSALRMRMKLRFCSYSEELWCLRSSLRHWPCSLQARLPHARGQFRSPACSCVAVSHSAGMTVNDTQELFLLDVPRPRNLTPVSSGNLQLRITWISCSKAFVLPCACLTLCMSNAVHV